MYKVNFINKKIIEVVNQGLINYMIDMSKVSTVIFNEIDGIGNFRVYILIPSSSNLEFKFNSREGAIKFYNDISSALILVNADETENDVIDS